MAQNIMEWTFSMVGDREENKRLKGEWADGDMPICEEYVYGGSEEHLKEIENGN